MSASGARNIPKLIRDLQRRKAREDRGLVIAEGRRLVADVLEAGVKVEALLAADDATERAVQSLLEAGAARHIDTDVVPRKDFDQLADTETPSGILAVVRWAPGTAGDLPAKPADRVRALVIDGVQDPGNVGTMIRTARALGAGCTVALDGTADVRNPKVVRSAMGALFRHHVIQASWRELRDAWGASGPTIMLAVQDGEPIGPGIPTDDIAIVIGSEARGVRPEWEAWAEAATRITIPMRPGAESLNAAVAAGILLHELGRAE